MRLHREEAYSPITNKSHVVQRIRAEAARRTFVSNHDAKVPSALLEVVK